MVAADLDLGWTLIGGILVFFMHAGFSILESGFVRPKSSQGILLKNLVNMGISAIAWFVFGYGVAFGDDNHSAVHKGGFIGTTKFWSGHSVLRANGDTVADAEDGNWFFQFTFCATAATIVSGALAERCKLEGFAIFAFLSSAFLYPIVVHWTWGGGFLGAKGYNDFAGSGIVHMFGGWSALVGAIILGPRTGRFAGTEAANKEFEPSSILNITLGTFILWFGWYGFNAGSTVQLSDNASVVAARCCITTTMSACCGGLVTFALASYRQGLYDILGFTNGVLGGLVGITAGCANTDPTVVIFIGIVAGILVEIFTVVLMKLKIDDPVGAFPVHGCCGVWGVLCAGLFDRSVGLISGESDADFDTAFGPNCVGIVCIALWAMGTAAPIFLVLKMLGLFRVSEKTEEAGADSRFSASRDPKDGIIRKSNKSGAEDATGMV